MKYALLRTTLLLAAVAPHAFAAPAAPGRKAPEQVISIPAVALSANGAELLVEPREIRTSGPRGADELWFGNAQLKVPSLYFAVLPIKVKVKQIEQKVRTTTRGKLADSQADSRIASVELFGQRMEDIHLGLRMEKFDLAEMHRVGKDVAFITNTMAALEPLRAQRENVLMAMARSAVRHGSRIVLDDFSVSYKNFRARMTGQIGLRNASETDLASLPLVFRKLEARFDISVPAGIPRAMCQAFVHTMPTIQGDGMARWQQQQNCYQAAVSKMENEGWARMEDGVLRSTITVSQGKLSVNGKSTEVNLNIH